MFSVRYSFNLCKLESLVSLSVVLTSVNIRALMSHLGKHKGIKLLWLFGEEK